MVAHQASPSLGSSRQKHWSGLPFPSPMRESEVAQSCPTLSDPMDCSPPGSSVHGIFQARVLEWGAIAFSVWLLTPCLVHGFSCLLPRNRLELALTLTSQWASSWWEPGTGQEAEFVCHRRTGTQGSNSCYFSEKSPMAS